MFADRAEIYIRSGKGGDGSVSFRRELFVAAGGPNGGDGGKGGDIIFEVDEGLNTLADFRFVRKYCAEDGENGGTNRCTGKNGADKILKGGRGGKGNQHYATATMQVPKYAQPGQDAQELNVILELKVIADVGLVGFPNVGKSTFLSRVTNAKPKIANYHFTTLNPNLGVVDMDGANGFVIADIPGLIEGASEGIGLGHEFLRHVERTRVIIHVVDVASTEGRDPIEDIKTINAELAAYDPNLAKKPQIIAANKTDVMLPEEAEEAVNKLREAFAEEGYPIYSISAVSGKGVKELLYAAAKLLSETKEDPIVFEREFSLDNLTLPNDPYTVEYDEKDKMYVVEGPRIEKMLGYTNIDSEKGFEFFQNFLKNNGILEELEAMGIQDGDTVRMYGLQFDYYK